MEEMSIAEVLFFEKKQAALPLYEALRKQVIMHCENTKIQVKKTQISFVNRHLYAMVSFTPVRPAKERPNPFITVSFGLDYPIDSIRIDAAIEAYPHRWTHHLIVGSIEEIDDELISWVIDAASFANRK